MEYIKFFTSIFNWNWNWNKGFLIDYFKFLPEEIVLDILSRPAESVLLSKLVCTTWRNIVSSHPWFSKMYLHHLNHPSHAVQSGKLGFLAFTDMFIARKYYCLSIHMEILTRQ